MPDIRQTGFLDDCDRPPENPLSHGGRWTTMPGFNTQLELGVAATDPNENSIRVFFGPLGNRSGGSIWNPESFTGDHEVWGKTDGSPDLSEGWRLILCAQSTNNIPGYILMVNNAVGTGSSGSWNIFRYDPARTELARTLGPEIPKHILFRRVGGNLEAWSGSLDAQTWTLVLTVTDSTYMGGYVGIVVDSDDPGPGWTGIGGGLPREDTWIPQVYRRLRRG